MKKFLKLCFNIITFFWFGYSCCYSKTYLSVLKETTYLWFTIIIPSILPMYLFGNLLLCNKKFFKPLFLLTNKFLFFENELACLIFWMSILIGNPTSTCLIVEALNKEQISLKEGNRLMRATSHLSPIFIWMMSGNIKIFLIFFLSLIISSLIILRISKNMIVKKIKIKNEAYLPTINKIIDNGPLLLLKILLIMIIINFFKTFCLSLNPFPNQKLLLYPLSFLEITIGAHFINQEMAFSLTKILLLGALFSTTGFAIMLQVINSCKNILNIFNYLKYRLLHLLITLCLLIFNFIIFK